MFTRRKKRVSMEIVLNRLSSTFQKQAEPACASCHYDAEWIIRIAGEGVASLERMFCERCMVDALLDAVNFKCAAPNYAA